MVARALLFGPRPRAAWVQIHYEPGQLSIEVNDDVSTATAKTHVSRVLTKLQARDRAQLVVTAYESGLISPGDA